jgi:hypothetical protein
VLITTKVDSSIGGILKDSKKVEGVDEALAVYGIYDIIASVRANLWMSSRKS